MARVMVCARSAGLVPRPGSEMCCSPQGTGGRVRAPSPPPAAALLPWLHPEVLLLLLQGEGFFQLEVELMGLTVITEGPWQSCTPQIPR